MTNNPTGPAAGTQRDKDLALLAAGIETGWWDEHGRPAPWPADFWLDDGTVNPDWQPAGGPAPAARPGQPPF